jgi:hypothetical protein
LEVAHELSVRQEELYPSLTEALGRDPYTFWVRRSDRAPRSWFEKLVFRADLRRLQSGRFERWEWSFHGLECDLRRLLTDRRAGSVHASEGPFDSYLARRLVLSPAAGELVQGAAGPGVAVDE